MADFETWSLPSLVAFAADTSRQIRELRLHIDDLQLQVSMLTREARNLHFQLGEANDTRSKSKSAGQESS